MKRYTGKPKFETLVEDVPEAGLEVEPGVKAPVKPEPTVKLTEAEIESRYQAFLEKIRGGK